MAKVGSGAAKPLATGASYLGTNSSAGFLGIAARNVATDAYEAWARLTTSSDVPATITLDLRNIANNLTYGDHYRLSVYVGCQPCPPHYICNMLLLQPTCDQYPPLNIQTENYENCLAEHKELTCLTNGTDVEPLPDGGARVVPARFRESSLAPPARFRESPLLASC